MGGKRREGGNGQREGGNECEVVCSVPVPELEMRMKSLRKKSD